MRRPDELFEDVAHLHVIDALGVQIDPGKLPYNQEQAVRVIELFDFFLELELVEDLLRLGRKALDVGDEVAPDVVGVPEQLGEGEGADIVEWLAPVFRGDLRQLAVDGAVRQALRLELLVLFEHGVLGGFKNAVEAPQNGHRQHDASILRRPVGSTQLVCDPKYEVDEILLGGFHSVSFPSSF